MIPFELKSVQWINTLNSSLVELNDLESELQNYLCNMELDSEKVKQVEDRFSQIFNVSRKHKVLPQELFNYTEQIAATLTSLNSNGEDLIKLETACRLVAENYQEQAGNLTQRRSKAAHKLGKEMTATIRSLSLPHSELTIELEKENTPLALHGNEKIVFHIKTNPDQPLQPLAKVISGGELSRLSLSAHLALASRTNIPTLIFDEVDTGLSGATAEKIGKLLRKLGESYQVFCVTHQAQVAACGHHHLFVEKCFEAKSTYTRLRLLSSGEKTKEIARMLGGEKITEKTLAHAKEVLQGV
jgi:DNA repair protein RecN (Recombination protein N)